MKHLIQSKTDTLAALCDAALLVGLQKVCLIVDVQGKLRVLALLEDTEPSAAKETAMRAVLTTAGEDYWSGDLLIQRAKTHVEGNSRASDTPLFDAVWREAIEEPRGHGKVYVLQRRFSKESWFDASAKPPWPLHVKTPR